MNGMFIYIAPGLSILSLLSFSLHSRNRLKKKPVQRYWLRKRRLSLRRHLDVTRLTSNYRSPQAENCSEASCQCRLCTVESKARLRSNAA